MSIGIKPLGARVVIKKMEAEEKTEAGLLLSGSAKEKPQQVCPHSEMSKLPNTKSHQRAADSQEKGANSHKGHRSEETAIGAQLEP